VFFDEVRIPVANRVGDEHDGWRVAMVTFSFERGTAFISELLASMEQLADLARLAKEREQWDDAGVRREIGHLRAELDALWALTKRNVSQAQRSGVPGPGGSVFKQYYADVKKRMGELAFALLGRDALALGEGENPDSLDHVALRLYTLSLSIAAGTSQIQKNIVAERVLGLPKG
jgi:alkylation response protein AidB-like acyl-CoA dehydrogenase